VGGTEEVPERTYKVPERTSKKIGHDPSAQMGFKKANLHP